MTGHLAALAATAQGATPRAVPRPRSRFEVSGGWLDRGAAESLTEEAIDVAAPRPRRAAAPDVPPARAVTAVRRDAPAAAVSTMIAPPVAGPAQRRARPESEPPVAHVPDVRAAASVAPPPAVRRPLEPRDGRKPIITEQGIASVTPTTPAHAPRATEAPAAVPPALRPQATLPLPRPIALPVGALVPPPLPPSAPVAVPATQPPRTSAALADAPDVHVTIGRLEIRTGPGRAGPTERTGAAPAAGLRTLEEYGAARAAAAGGAR